MKSIGPITKQKLFRLVVLLSTSEPSVLHFYNTSSYWRSTHCFCVIACRYLFYSLITLRSLLELVVGYLSDEMFNYIH